MWLRDEELRRGIHQELRCVVNPALIRSADGELPIQHPGRDRLFVIALVVTLNQTGEPTPRSPFARQVPDALLADPLAVLKEIFSRYRRLEISASRR